LQEDGGWVVCRVFKKNKNLKMKLQERALSYEEQMGLLPEPLGSPDILSNGGGQRYAFPDHTIKPLASVKREIINLDEYSPGSNLHNNYSFQGPTSEQMRSYLTRTLSMKRPEDVHHHFYTGSYDQAEEGTSLGDFNDAGTSGSDVDGEYNDDSTISGLENVDWSALLQEPTTVTTKSTTTEPSVGGDVTVLLQLKRQNSDLFSSLDLWNYSQIAQQM